MATLTIKIKKLVRNVCSGVVKPLSTLVLVGSVVTPGLTVMLAPTTVHADACQEIVNLGGTISGPRCVETADLRRGSVNSGKIANNSVTSEDLRQDSVGASEIIDNIVGTAEIANGSVESIDILDDTVGTNDLEDGGVRGTDILDNDVTTNDIRNESLQAIDILDEAGANFAGGDQIVSLSNVATVVRSVIIDAPTSGVVIVNASGHFRFSDTVGVDLGRCSITTDIVLDSAQLMRGGEQTGDSMESLPFALTRGFEVNPGPTTFNLVCDELSGTVDVRDSSLTGIYVPTRYEP